ncbi:3-hydroxybutyryl-CoA dehydrogenase [Streptomyces canarius]
MYAESKEPLYAPPALLRRTVAARRPGHRSERGFHTYGR